MVSTSGLSFVVTFGIVIDQPEAGEKDYEYPDSHRLVDLELERLLRPPIPNHEQRCPDIQVVKLGDQLRQDVVTVSLWVRHEVKHVRYGLLDPI
jgi:hypothetical protein